MLLQALADFPAVVSRRLDAEPAADSPWHELGRALIVQGIAVDCFRRGRGQLLEFGACAMLVTASRSGRGSRRPTSCSPTSPARPRARARRDELLDALFDGRADESTRAYLRQAVRWLRHVLPESSVIVEGGEVRLAGDVRITTESDEVRGRAG